MYSPQRPLPAALHPELTPGCAAGEVWAKHAHSAVASQSCPHSCTVSRQLSKKIHEFMLPLASRQKPTPRATDRAVAGGGDGWAGGGGGEGDGGGGRSGEGEGEGEGVRSLAAAPPTVSTQHRRVTQRVVRQKYRALTKGSLCEPPSRARRFCSAIGLKVSPSR